MPYISQTYHEWFRMLGVMQVKISAEVGEDHSLPGVRLLEFFHSIEFLKEFRVENGVSNYLLKGIFKSKRQFEQLPEIESFEMIKIYEIDDTAAIFSAKMSGPIPQMLSYSEDVWPSMPTIFGREGLVLTLQGSSVGLTNVRRNLLDIFGTHFRVSVNNNFQGQWDTAPGLPRRRKEVLETAIKMGYYNAPRKCRQRDIADSIGLKQGTVAEHLQIAESLIINAWYNQAERSGK